MFPLGMLRGNLIPRIAAVFIRGEANSEIEKSAAKAHRVGEGDLRKDEAGASAFEFL
jgi:hypothetical protein